MLGLVYPGVMLRLYGVMHTRERFYGKKAWQTLIYWFIFNELGDDAGKIFIGLGGIKYTGCRSCVAAAFIAGEQGAQIDPAALFENAAAGADGNFLPVVRFESDFDIDN